MTRPANQTITQRRINLRPTLVVGLGGSGVRIAVQLKARLEEQFGKNGAYTKAIRFLCFDTANETHTAPYPSQPEQLARLTSEEYIRISDVPLQTLMQNRESNPVVSAILPERLYTTQIDQGAQQVRRLGRVALLYRYVDVVRDSVSRAIGDLRRPRNMNFIGKSEDEKYDLYLADRDRLRVFVLASICGGTGSGTFIDMAYIVRHLAKPLGLEQRSVDVIGMFLLPEAFPDIKTTGASRIRANAYAALLDLEYYNQSASVEHTLYRQEMQDGSVIEGSGPPYSLVYLIQRSNKSLGALPANQLPSVLADTLYALIGTHMGEQMDATLDNIRASLTTYFQGYRAFYSSIGFSQLIYPELWLRKQFVYQLRARLIDEQFLKPPMQVPELDTVRAEIERDIIPGIRVDLLQETIVGNDIVRALNRLATTANESTDPIGDLQRAYYQAYRAFQSRVATEIIARVEVTTNKYLNEIDNKVAEHIQATLAANNEHSLRWLAEWLEYARNVIQDNLQNIDQNRGASDELTREYNEQIRLMLRAANRRLNRPANTLRKAATTLVNLLRQNAIDAVIEAEIYSILHHILDRIEQHERNIARTISFFFGLASYQPPMGETDYNELTIPSLEEHELRSEVEAKVEQVMADDRRALLVARMSQQLMVAVKDVTNLCLPDYEQLVDDTLTNFCRTIYQQEENSQSRSNLVQKVLQSSDLANELNRKASPLLMYEQAILQAMPPRQIKVVGALTRQDAEKLMSEAGLGEGQDVNPAGIDEASRLMLLVTHHGIPAQAIQALSEYQDHYQKQLEQPNAIFHLDPIRENEPYDPGSIRFVNIYDFEMLLARALAYEWIMPVIASTDTSQFLTFGLSYPFDEHLKDRIHARREHIKTEIEQIELDETQSGYREETDVSGDYLRQIKRKESLELILDDLDFHLRLLPMDTVAESNLQCRFTSSDNNKMTPRTMLQLRLSDALDAKLPTSLDEVMQILYGSGRRSREMPSLFQQAFEDLMTQQFASMPDADTAQIKFINRFLDARKYQSHSFKSQHNIMVFSRRGERSHALERRLCDMLNVYRRQLRRNMFQQRWWFYDDVDDTPNTPSDDSNGDDREMD